MSSALKKIIKNALPTGALYGIKCVHAAIALRGARAAFKSASSTSDEPLPISELEKLQARYCFPPEYGYDVETMRHRGAQRASEVLKLTGAQNRHYLEAGCADGMTCAALARAGKSVIGLDISRKVAAEATVRGTVYCTADAMKLPFRDASFDVYYSYNAYEHIPDPGVAFAEALRVTRPGGYIYLNFGPLFMAPLGLHAYRQITVPYCQFLFSQDTMQEFADAKGLGKIPFDSVNGWTLEQYRQAWRMHEDAFETVLYREVPHVYGQELIETYPQSFRAKTGCFDNLVCSLIEAVFRKL